MEGAKVAEAGEAVGERVVREARKFGLPRTLDASAVPDEASQDDDRGEQPKSEEQRQPSQLRQFEGVGRPVVRAAREDGFRSPHSDNAGQGDARGRERSEGGTVQGGHGFQ